MVENGGNREIFCTVTTDHLSSGRTVCDPVYIGEIERRAGVRLSKYQKPRPSSLKNKGAVLQEVQNLEKKNQGNGSRGQAKPE
jgi:hypothetical protein